MQYRDPVFNQCQRQGLRIRGDIFGRYPQRSPHEIADPYFLKRHVKGKRETLVNPVFFMHAQNRIFTAQKVANTALADFDALGLARRSGGVNHVSRVRWQHARPAHQRGRWLQQSLCRPNLAGRVPQPGQPFRAADQTDRASIFKTDRNALNRRIGIKWQPRRSRLGNSGLHGQQGDAARQPETHAVAGAHAGLDQVGGYLVRLRI